MSQLVLVLLVGAACEIEPGQPDLECLSCQMLHGGTQHVLPATVQVVFFRVWTGGRKTPANPGPAVVSWLSMGAPLTQIYSVGFISREGLREKPNPRNFGRVWRRGHPVPTFGSDIGVWALARE